MAEKPTYEELEQRVKELERKGVERKQVADALRESEEKYSTLVENSLTRIYIDQDEKIVFANEKFAEIYGYSRDELTGMETWRLVHPEDRPLTKEMRSKRLKGEEAPKEYEARGLRKDSGLIWVVRRNTRIEYKGRSAILGNIVDITKRKSLEAQLLQAQKMEAIGTLAGGIAHDFNNLLMGVQGNISMMLMGIDTSHPNYERLKNIEKQVERGSGLTSQLLGYARKGRYEVKPISLNQTALDISEIFGRTKKDITIHREFAEDLLAIEADNGQIEQVFLNLLVNAADAMPGGGDLILKTTNTTHKGIKDKIYDPKPGNYALLTVTDTGLGMDKKTMKCIFDPFFTTKEMGRGTGLGLASAYGIIRGHGGYIDVDSKKGRGTTFSIYLPATRKRGRKVSKSAEQLAKGTGTVLLVDDEEVILEVGKDLLETMGHRVLVAKNGKQAIKVYRENRDEIGIVVLDMVMPNIGGGEAYDRMKKINPDVKVLLSSGFSIEGEATEILERGCNGFIQKPFRVNELSEKIMEILDRR